MTVSEQIIDGILNLLRCDARTDDKRVDPRVGISARALITTGRDDFFWAHVRDLSRSGVGLLHRESMVRDSCFLICLNADGRGSANPVTSKALRCQVVRCAKVGDALFVVGARFVDHTSIVIPRTPAAHAATQRPGADAHFSATARRS